MDEFKSEDELKPDPSGRRTGHSCQSSEHSEHIKRGEPRINFNDIELDDTDGRRPTCTQKARNEEPETKEEVDESEDETVDEGCVERRPYKRRRVASKPTSRQHMMMGVDVLVLLLLIIDIGSVLKAPSASSSDQIASNGRSIDLAGNVTDQVNSMQPAPGTVPAENTQQDVPLSPISSTLTRGQAPMVTDGQQRVEVQDGLNNALTQPQNQ